MFKIKFHLLALGFFLAFANNDSHSAPVSVRGHIRRDGIYVPPHRRTSPNGSKWDNWSTVGNVNPYTGKHGTTDPLGTSFSSLPTYAFTPPVLTPDFRPQNFERSFSIPTTQYIPSNVHGSDYRYPEKYKYSFIGFANKTLVYLVSGSEYVEKTTDLVHFWLYQDHSKDKDFKGRYSFVNHVVSCKEKYIGVIFFAEYDPLGKIIASEKIDNDPSKRSPITPASFAEYLFQFYCRSP